MNRWISREPALDGLRGLAILWVIPHNSDVFLAEKNWVWPFAVVAHTGWIGVQLFFVLSGFLITGKLLDTRNASNYYSVFYGRRILRIFPLYFLTLIGFLLVLPHFVELPSEILASYRHQVWLWVFLNNWAQAHGNSVYWFTHFWSLAIEEQFYVVWPFVVAWLSGSRLLWFCAITIALACLARIAMLASGADSQAVYLLTITRMDALAFGALAAIALRSDAFVQAIRARRALLLWSALTLLAGCGLLTHVYDTTRALTITGGYTILAAGLSVIVLLAALETAQGVLTNPVLRTVGKYSFAMYVFHIPISLCLQDPLLAILKPIGSAYPLIYSVCIGVLSFAAAVLSYHLVEKHFLGLKYLFEPRSTPGRAS
ncbi:MAG: acyltransferase [Pseudomonadota bacterium]